MYVKIIKEGKEFKKGAVLNMPSIWANRLINSGHVQEISQEEFRTAKGLKIHKKELKEKPEKTKELKFELTTKGRGRPKKN